VHAVLQVDTELYSIVLIIVLYSTVLNKVQSQDKSVQKQSTETVKSDAIQWYCLCTICGVWILQYLLCVHEEVSCCFMFNVTSEIQSEHCGPQWWLRAISRRIQEFDGLARFVKSKAATTCTTH